MSFKFTPGCCCRQIDTIDPCIPDCQEIFSGFYNQFYYEGHVGHYGTLPGKDDIASYDSVSYISINILDSYDNTGPDCALFVLSVTSSAITGTRYYTFSANKTDKDISGLSSSQYGTHIIGRNVTTYEYSAPRYEYSSLYHVFDIINTSGNISSSAIRVGGSSSVNTLSNKPFDEKAYRNYIRTYSYDSFHHSVQDVKYTRLFCLPFDICEYRFHFTYVTTGFFPGWDSPRLLITTDSNYKQFYVPITGKEETEDCELSCGFTMRDTCAAQVPSGYATIFDASDITTALNSLTNDNIIDYWTVRLYGIRTPPARYFAAAEFGVVVVWTSDGIKVPVVMGNISVANCDLTFDNFDTGYNTSPNNIDYPTLLTSYSNLNASTGELTESSIESSIVFGSENGNIPRIWHSSSRYDENHKTNSTRFNGVYWVYAAITPCNEPFREKVTTGSLTGYATYSGLEMPIALYSIDNTAGSWTRVHQVRTQEHSSSFGYYDVIDEVWRTPLTFIKSLEDFSASDLDSFLYNFTESVISHYRANTRIHKPAGYKLKKLIYGFRRTNETNFASWPEHTLYSGYYCRDNFTEPMDGVFHKNLGPFATANIDHTEEIIYGHGFETLIDYNGDTVYIPSLTMDQAEDLFGNSGTHYYYATYNWLDDYPVGRKEKPNFYLEGNPSTIYVMPCVQIQYMAVWEPDNE